MRSMRNQRIFQVQIDNRTDKTLSTAIRGHYD